MKVLLMLIKIQLFVKFFSTNFTFEVFARLKLCVIRSTCCITELQKKSVICLTILDPMTRQIKWEQNSAEIVSLGGKYVYISVHKNEAFLLLPISQ